MQPCKMIWSSSIMIKENLIELDDQRFKLISTASGMQHHITPSLFDFVSRTLETTIETLF